MPELPEVETVRRVLESQIKGKRIVDIEVFYNNLIENDDVESFKKKLIGKTFDSFNRLGKYLYFGLDDLYLISHLRMEGKYFIKDKNLPKEKHEHLIFYFSDGSTLRYHDTRKFGRMEIKNKEDILTTEPLSLLGREAYNLDKDYLKKVLNVKRPIKELLLEQNRIAGIGNIYADEILFLSKINPLRLGSSLNDMELESISINSKEVMEKAILAGGTTIRSYTSSLGVTGRFQNELYCHTMKNCKICGSEILKIRVGGRGTYYCPICQK